MHMKNVILEKSFEFALSTVEFTETLEEKRKYVVAKQLLKSGTSIGANVREAQFAESTADFIHKMRVFLKEANETEYWLSICKQSGNYPDPGKLTEEVIVLRKFLIKIINSASRK